MRSGVADRRRTVRPLVALVACLAACMIPVLAAAKEPADFFAGKQVHLLVSAASGGAYDTYARLIAQHMPDHIPGRPVIVVQNMPGAAGIKATNYMYSVAPRDGTSIAAVSSGVPLGKLMFPNTAEYDPNRLSWIGNVSRSTRIGYVWHTAPIHVLDEARTKAITVGATALGTGSADLVVVADELFGFKFKLVTGYKGAPEVKLAMERGEVQGMFGNQLSDLKTSKPEWLREGKVRILTQFGLEKSPELPDVPLFVDLAKTREDRQLLEFLLARQTTSAPYLAPPALPSDRLGTLRRAFDATVRDPKFLAGAQRAKLEVDQPMTGEEVAALVAKLSETPVPVVERLDGIFAKYKATAN